MGIRALPLLAALAIPAAGLAQPQTQPVALQFTLKDAVKIALAPEGNTRVRLAEEALKQAEAQQSESRAALLPDLEG